MKKFLLLLFAIPIFITSGQNIDSLYNEFLSVRGINQNVKPQVIGEITLPVKCGFGIVNQVKMNYDKFSVQQKILLKKILDRPITDTSFVTPSGKFRIHFMKSGVDAPGYNMNQLAQAADSSYNYEVNILGYPPPPGDAGVGGDDRYDIYIQNLSGGLYGYTEFENQITSNTYTCYTVMDNDFGTGYYTHGIDAARVTIAHEFHHGIQIGNYIYRSNDTFYYELTSTSMEEFVYDSINDYYNYMDTYFRNPQNAFSSNNGYDLAIWNIFLKDRFGANIIKRTWELMRQERAVESIADAILEAGSTLKTEFNKFGLWTYFTNTRAIPNKYFEEAAYYPLIHPLMTSSFTKPSTTVNITSEPISNNFILFTNGVDNLISIVSNADLNGAIASPVTNLSLVYTLSSEQITGSRKILDGYYSKIESANSLLLGESNIFNDIPIDNGQLASVELDYVYPQPFKYSVNNLIFIPVAKSNNGLVDLYIYSPDMNLVYSSQKPIVAADQIVVIWNGRDNNNNKLGTGVYIYVTKSGDTVKKGKLVIQND
ncbi:MAG: hypothetical protein FIA82_04060 [Melioribacter sp.]|nr:hypothetical protein [Melioribacter sp.]